MRAGFSPWDNRSVKTAASSELFRKLPSVDDVVRVPAIANLVANYGHDSVVDAVRVVLARLRREVTSGLLNDSSIELALSGLPEAVEQQVRQPLSYSLRPVINATGVILHTNLGRAALSDEAIEHIRETAATYSPASMGLVIRRQPRFLSRLRILKSFVTRKPSPRSPGSRRKAKSREHRFAAAVRFAKPEMPVFAKHSGGPRSAPFDIINAFEYLPNAYALRANRTRKSSSQQCGSCWSWPTAFSKVANLTKQP